MSWTRAWDLWLHGHQLGPNVRIWGLRLLWWGRIADILAFVFGLSVVFELLGAHPLEILGKKLTERAKRAQLMRKYAPIYARQLGTYNDLCQWLEVDIKEALRQHSALPPAWSAFSEAGPVARTDYRQLAVDVYREIIDHECGEGADKLCVHGYELIRDRVWKFMGETGMPDEQESWKINDDNFTGVLSILMAVMCWLAMAIGVVLGIIALVQLLPVIWLITLVLLALSLMSFWALAWQQSPIPLEVLAVLSNVRGKPKLWNKPFLYLFHWTGKRYYGPYGRIHHSATWRISAVMAQYALASALIPVTRPTGFVLNRPKPDHLLRWIFLVLFIVSFFPFIITQ